MNPIINPPIIPLTPSVQTMLAMRTTHQDRLPAFPYMDVTLPAGWDWRQWVQGSHSWRLVERAQSRQLRWQVDAQAACAANDGWQGMLVEREYERKADWLRAYRFHTPWDARVRMVCVDWGSVFAAHNRATGGGTA